MPTRTQPATQTLLTRALKRTGLNFTRRDGDLYWVMTGEEPEDYSQWWLVLEGETCRILSLSCLVQPPIPWQHVTEALAACQAFHETFRFGRVYLQADAERHALNFRFEGQLDVTPGISEALLRTYIESHVASACAFLTHVRRDTQVFGSPKPQKARKHGSVAGRRRGNGGRTRKRGGGAIDTSSEVR